MKIVNREISFDPNDKVFGKHHYVDLCKLMNWYSGNDEDTKKINNITVTVKLEVKEND